MVLHLNKLKFPSPKDASAKFGWNWPIGSREEDENVKSFYDNYNDNDDNDANNYNDDEQQTNYDQKNRTWTIGSGGLKIRNFMILSSNDRNNVITYTYMIRLTCMTMDKGKIRDCSWRHGF